MDTIVANAPGGPDERNARTVYVVRRRMAGNQFVAAERDTAGNVREYATEAEAHAAAAWLGGPKAGFRVFTEWRNAEGLPCDGAYIRSAMEPE